MPPDSSTPEDAEPDIDEGVKPAKPAPEEEAQPGTPTPGPEKPAPVQPIEGTPEPVASPAATAQARHQDAYRQVDTEAAKRFSEQDPFLPASWQPPTPAAEYKKAEQSSDEQAREQAANDREQRTQAQKTENAAREAQMRGSGQRFYQDPFGRIQPIVETETGKPLYTPSAHREEGVDPKTGAPALVTTDKYGEKQFQRPPIIANPDLNDDQLYYKMPSGEVKPAGKIDDLVNHPDFAVARTAMRAQRQRREATWKEAIAPMKDLSDQATAQFDQAQLQHDDLGAKAEALQEQLTQLTNDPQLNQTTGGIAGYGAKPTDASVQKRAALASVQTQLDQLTAQQGQLAESLKPGGHLATQKKAAALHLAIFKAKAAHDSYADQAQERRAVLAQQGKSEKDDPVLNSITQAQASLGGAIDGYSGQAQKVGPVPPAGQPGAASQPPQQLAGEPQELYKAGVKAIGGVGIEEFARRYGAGNGPVQPLALLKMKVRSQDIAETLADKSTQLDATTRTNLTTEQKYLDQLFTQRFANLAPDQQNKLAHNINDMTTSAGGAAARAAVTGIAPAGGAWAGFEAGAVLGEPSAPFTYGLGPLVTGAIGAAAGSFFANKAQKNALEKFAPGTADELQRLQSVDWEQHPYAVTAGNAASSLPFFKLDPMATVRGITAVSKIARGAVVTEAEKAAAKALAVQGGFATALGIITPLVHGQKPTVSEVTQSAAQMMLFGNSRMGAKAAIQHVDNMFPDLFWKRSGMDAKEFAQYYPDAVRRVATNQATPEDVDMVQRVNAAAKDAGVKVGDLARGRVVAETYTAEARGIQKAIPEAYRPNDRSQGPGVKFSKPGEQPEAKPGTQPDEPAASGGDAADQAFARDENNPEADRKALLDAGRPKEKVEAMSDAEAHAAAQNHADDAAEAAHAVGDLVPAEAPKPEPASPAAPAEPEKTTTEHEAVLEQRDPEKLAHIKEQLATREISNKEYADQIADASKAAPLKELPKDTEFLYEQNGHKYFQVERTPESPRGRTVDEATLKQEGFDTSKLSSTSSATDGLKGPNIGAAGHDILRSANGLRETLQKEGDINYRVEVKGNKIWLTAEKDSDNSFKPQAIAYLHSTPDGETKIGGSFALRGHPEPALAQLAFDRLNRFIADYTKNSDKSVRETSKPGALQEGVSSTEALPSSAPRLAQEQGINQPTESPETKHGAIEGEKLDKDWTQFAPEAKGLGIPRAEMPQVHAEHRGALVNFLKGQGIESKQELIRPTDLKPTQNEYSEAKVEKARKFEGGDRSILVSSDNHVVDGHHQWVAALHDNPGKPMKVIRLNAPIAELLPKVHAFPSTETQGGEQPAAPAKIEAPKTYGDHVVNAAAEIQKAIGGSEKMTWQRLFEITDKAFGGTMAGGKYSVKDAYDSMELAMNKYILAHPDLVGNTAVDAKGARVAITRLKMLMERLPTQTKRTSEMDDMQQFSTPPSLAFAANWVANLRPTDVYLEPSVGTGDLAVFAKATGVKEVLANELSERRAEIIQKSGIADKVTKHNAEYLGAMLDKDFKSGKQARPTVVVMNPPFSNGAESGKRGDTMVGARHVEDALKLLPPGGRLVAIVGEGMAFGKSTFNQWWAAMREKYDVRANIGISGQEYAKYGTTFDNQILVIDKNGPTASQPITGKVDKVEDLVQLLEGIRNDRSPISQPGAVEKPPVEPGGIAPVEKNGDLAERGAPGDNAPAQSGNPPAVGAERVGRAPGDNKPVGQQPAKPGEGAVEARAGAEAGRPAGGNAGPGSGPNPVGAGPREPTASTELTTETREPAQPGTETAVDDEAVYAPYSPAKAKITGSKPHPTALVESSAMSSVPPPDPKYVPNLPKEVVTSGKLSEAQLENILYAGQAHEKLLPSGERRGYFIGDGTGVGKGRQIAGIIMDNHRQGRQRHVWISKTSSLADAARADLEALGMKGDMLVPINKLAAAGTGTIKMDKGVLFSTYTSLASGHEGLNTQGMPRRKNPDKISRLEQIANWLGKDFDGVLAFDEAHQAGNAVAVKTNRGMKDPSNAGIAVVDLQKLLPKARVVYGSATGATEPSNLSYADRLGIWGPNTPFPNKLDFFDKISSGGVSSMEIVARDLKALGSYMARTLSFEGVKFNTLQQVLTQDQHQIYNKVADAWSGVFQNMDQMMAQTGAANNSQARGAARSAFFGAQQRFFNQVLTAMEMPIILKDVRASLDAGHSAVLQLVNTNEATQEREIARNQTEEKSDLEDLELSPKDILLEYVDKSFPTTLYKEVVDPGNGARTIWVPVTDEKGDPIPDPEALEKKQELMMELQHLQLPDNPLEQLLNTFGHENVAEITGRSQRIVQKADDQGNKRRVIESGRNDAKRKVEAGEFRNGKRRILVFSNKGGTGESYHASRQIKNQQLRVHYLVQAGWRADVAIQGLGRTHRSDQAQTPLYKLGSTDIPGHKRFVSTIARRMAQLGALTTGERRSTGQGLFSEKDNLESKYADDGLQRFFADLFGGRIDGLDFGEVSRQMGFGHSKKGRTGDVEWTSSLIDPKTGGLNVGKLPTIQQFLNRVLALKIPDQNKVFDAFLTRMEKRIENAKTDGTFDPGTQTYKAASIKKVSDEVVYKHPDSTAETRIVAIDATDPVHFTQFGDIPKLGTTPVERYVKNITSGRIYALKEGPPRTSEAGAVVPTFRRIGTRGSPDIHPQEDFADDKYETISDDAAEKAWSDEIANSDKNKTTRENFVVGAFLPIWDRLRIDSPKIYRFQTDQKENMLGALIPPKQVDAVRRRLGATVGAKKPADIVRAIVEDGTTQELANGWSLKRVTVSGNRRIEVTGPNFSDLKDFKDRIGGFTERIGFQTRSFMPATGPESVEAMGRLLEKSPVVSEGESQEDIIARLQGLKIHKPGTVAAGSPLSLAWDAAVDTAILAVKVGRKIQQVITTAVGRFRERYPGASAEDVRKLETALQTTVSKLEDVRQAGVDYAKGLKDEVSASPKFTPLTAALAKFEGMSGAGKMYIKNHLIKPFVEAVPSPEARSAMTAWIEADGNRGLLKEWRDGSLANPKTKQYAARYERALDLSATEIKWAKKAQAHYDAKLAQGQKEGFLGEGVEDYVNRMWDVDTKGEKFAAEHAPQLTQFFRNAMQRKFPNSFEGEQAGMKAKTYDLAELMGQYTDSFNRVSNSRKLIKDLTTKKASDGRPLAAPTGTWSEVHDAPATDESDGSTIFVKPSAKGDEFKDYKVFDHPAMNKWKWAGEDNGRPIMLRGSLALHPEAFDRVRNPFSESALKNWYRSNGTMMAAIPKWLAKKADGLNATVKGTALGFLSPFHQVQEGTHAIGHRINPFTNLPAIDLEKNPRQLYAMTHGLMLGEGSKGAAEFMQGLASETNPLYHIPGFGEMAKNYSTWLFHQYIPSLKMKTWEQMVERNTKLYGGKLTKDEVAYLSAIQANNAYGHLNYVVMGRNPTIQHILRLMFLSPDFSEARGRFVGEAAQGTFNKAGREQLHALAFLAMVFYMAARIGNSLLNDGDAKYDHPFSVVNGNREYSMRSVPEDIYRAFKDSRMFFYGRLSPLFRTLLEGITGKNARGEKISFTDSVKDLLTRAIPNTAGWAPGLNQLSEYGKNQTIDAWEQFLGAFGLQIKRSSPSYDAYKLANKYREDHGDKEDRGSYPTSIYQPLRYALEDANLARAKAEVDKLIEGASFDPEQPNRSATDSRIAAVKKIQKGFEESLFHPWTKNDKQDDDFRASLAPEDRAKVAAADKQREQIWLRFCGLTGTAPNSRRSGGHALRH